MRACVAVTDHAWSSFLRARPEISEVNFWQPTPSKSFGVISCGEPFLFKSHHPGNELIGGGFLSDYVVLPVSRAWAYFQAGNGVASLDELRASIARYRKRGMGAHEDPEIGCVLLRDAYFCQSDATVPAPPDFSKNIVRYKGYDLGTAHGSYIEDALRLMLRSIQPGAADVPGAVFGNPRLIAPRVGQQAFKALVESAYHRRCAVTGVKIVPALQAAHIRPISREGQNRVDNGLLLRADVHSMFDHGYLGIDTQNRLHVSPRLRVEFGNGEEFYRRAGEVIDVPDRAAHRPSRDAVTWHMNTVFQAS